MTKLWKSFKPTFMQRVWAIGDDGEPYSTMFTNAKTVKIALEGGNIFETREEASQYKLVAVRKDDYQFQSGTPTS